MEPHVDKAEKTITYRVRNKGTKAEIAAAKEGTKLGRGASFQCLISGSAITPEYVKRCGKTGNMSQTLIATLVQKGRKRFFIEPQQGQEEIAQSAAPTWAPSIRLPNHSQYVGVLGYGFEDFGDLFSIRQLAALEVFSDLVSEASARAKEDADIKQSIDSSEYAKSIELYLAFAVDRLADYGSTLATWAPGGFIRSTYSRHAIQMTWDYAECNFFSEATGNFLGAIDWVSKAITGLPARGKGSIVQRDAQSARYPAGSVISTDPPYYDNIPYADISDFFYAWLKRSVGNSFPDTLSTIAVPKMEELVADRMRHGSADNAETFFLDGMRSAVKAMISGSQDHAPATIYYAFKQNEIVQEGLSSTGWATFLDAVIDAGYAVCGTWPIRTERPGRMRAVGANALASSVVLVCRKREIEAESITRAEFIRALKRELPPAIAELQAANVSPADMPQSAIGPGMGVFSRYKAVLEADDSPMTVKTALQLINAELDEFLNDLHGEFDADTRFAATWFEQHGNDKGDYGSADNLARARGISVESVKHAGIVESSAGKVRILKRSELDPDWDPLEDDHLTIWECCQHLIRVLENDGEYAAAVLLKKIGSDKAETVKDLAYYLYEVCSTKRQDAKEATSYNGLIAVWTELTRQAATVRIEDQNRQTAMDI